MARVFGGAQAGRERQARARVVRRSHPDTQAATMRTSRKRWILLLLALLALSELTLWWLLRGSLAQLDGQQALPGLSAPVTIQRDADGTVTIDASSETDAMRALGYVHAQERFFEMDLMRRSAAETRRLTGPARSSSAVNRPRSILSRIAWRMSSGASLPSATTSRIVRAGRVTRMPSIVPTSDLGRVARCRTSTEGISADRSNPCGTVM